MARGSALGVGGPVLEIGPRDVTELAHDPGWARLLAAARRRLERTGGSLDGTATIVAPNEAERRVVVAVSGVRRSAKARRLAVRLRDADAYLTRTYGLGLVALVGGDIVETRQREAFVSLARSGRHAGEEWYDRWLKAIESDGTLARATRGGRDVTSVVRVLDALPAADELLSDFAERVLADRKALGDTVVRNLVLRAVAAWWDVSVPTTAAQRRSTWESVGVVPDPRASQVLVLNIPAVGGELARFLDVAAAVGMPVRLSLDQLRSAPIRIQAPAVFVTENPAVLKAATALGAAAPPVVCTEGVPSAAARRLLDAAAGATLYWHNNLDWPGVRLTASVLHRYPTAVPWRMAATDYLGAVGEGSPLSGPPTPTPWDDRLSEEMRRLGRAVVAERLHAVLLDDLRRAAR